MKRFFVFLILFLSIKLFSHFGMIIPSDDMISQKDRKTITLKIMFAHPFEGKMMDMEKPEFFLYLRGKNYNLTDLLKPLKTKFYADNKFHKAWKLSYQIKRPGDYIFYTKPKPYWEEEEDKFIVHYTKVVVNGFSLQESWDKEIGLPAEIVPLVRPYGIYTGNTFRGIVKFYGKPAPFAEIEVEYFNENGEIKAKEEQFITQVIKTDQNGVFSYSFPLSGWWGFAALGEGKKKLKHNGKDKDVEIGGVIWFRVYDIK